MVMMSPLEKVSPVPKLPSEDGNVNVHRTLSRPVNQNQRPLVGVIAAQNESTLFSSSLSDLVTHKLTLSSNKFLSRQLSTTTYQKTEVKPFVSLEETEGQTINNILPDDEELFSGMVDEIGIFGHANGTDDLEDFDVFTCGGGIELEPDEHLQAGQRNVGHSWGFNQNYHSINRPDLVPGMSMAPNGMINGEVSPHKGSRLFNGAGQSFSPAQVDNHRIPSFHPHSPQVQLHNLGVISSLDSMTAGMGDNFGLATQNKVNMDIHHLGLNRHAMDLNEGVFGYSPNGIHVHQALSNKSNSYQQQQHLHSLLMLNSPSLPNNHTHHLGCLPGVSHLMMNMISPIHQLQVGSAPGLKASASLWERQQLYSGESHDSSGYQMGSLRDIGIPGFSASHPREIASHGSLPRRHNSSGVHSPQRMSHVFHERSLMGSLPTSFGSPSERVRTRRSEANNLSHADRKHYELNVDRILRGDDTRTTLMIKNIPNKYTSKMLLATIDEQHRGKYDFIYLPIDFKNKCNMGYAFINMVDSLHIVSFHKTFEGRKWEKFNSEKVATLAYGRIQGKSALIAHFQNSSLMNEDKRCRPILFHTDGPNAGDQEQFPTGTNFRSKPARLQVPFGEDDE